MPSERIAHYEIQDKIGEGGMGVVYRASDPKLRRDVALKILPEHFARDPERMTRFRREAQVLASLNHPNIGSIYGLEESDDGRHALVLELIGGPTLAERVEAGPTPVDEALPQALQIALALEAAHEQGLIHRDLKPANVKLTADGTVKVLDFGLAKALADDGSEASLANSPTFSIHATQAGVILGTAAYMSPEQARGKRVDKRADIWAFGVILFEMLSGERLFTGETVSDTLASVLKTDVDWSRLPKGTPRSLRRLLGRCLDRDARTRLRDIGEARIAIERAMAGDDDGTAEGVDEAGALTAASAREKTLRTRNLVTIIAGVVLAAVAAAAVWFLKPSPPGSPGVHFEIPVDDVNTSLSARGTMTAFSPDGRRLAYTSHGSLWVRDFDDVIPHELAGTAGAAKPVWSSDGEWILYGSGSQLWRIPTSGGEPRAICEMPGSFNPAAGAVWKEDRIIFCTGDGPLLQVPVQGGDHKTLLPLLPDDDDFHNVTDLAGRGLMFVVHRKSGTFDTIAAFIDGERKELLRIEGQDISEPVYHAGYIIYHREPTNPGIWAVPFSLSKMETVGEPVLVVPNGHLPSLSPDGTLAYVTQESTRRAQIAWVDRQGVVLETVGDSHEYDPFPALSPDETKVALVIGEESDDLWIMDLARGTTTRLTSTDEAEFDPQWSASGMHVLYAAGESDPTRFAIHAKPADGTEDARPVVRGGWPSVSSGGRYLAYTRWDTESGTPDLWYLTLDGDTIPDSAQADPMPFLETPARETAPRLSPDGRWIAYRSSESGRSEVYLKRFPSGEGRWQISTNGGRWVRWRGDGRELFYTEEDNIMSVAVDTSDGLVLGTPKLLFTRERTGLAPFNWPDGFDVTADGERFLIYTIEERDHERLRPPGITVVQNWASETLAR